MTDDLRTRILHTLINNTPPQYLAMPGDLSDLTTALMAVISDEYINSRGMFHEPDRSHVDDQGRTWEWCGGQPGTWAWRITANGPVEVEVRCAVCQRIYNVRDDSPGWSAVWTCCISCQPTRKTIGPPMTDDLRTRIAAVLLAHSDESDAGPDCTCGWEWQGYGLWKDCYADHLADAVIAELHGDCIYRYACPHCGDFWFDQSERMQRFALLHGKAHVND